MKNYKKDRVYRWCVDGNKIIVTDVVLYWELPGNVLRVNVRYKWITGSLCGVHSCFREHLPPGLVEDEVSLFNELYEKL